MTTAAEINAVRFQWRVEHLRLDVVVSLWPRKIAFAAAPGWVQPLLPFPFPHPMAATTKQTAYIATYTKVGGEGIYLYSFEDEKLLWTSWLLLLITQVGLPSTPTNDMFTVSTRTEAMTKASPEPYQPFNLTQSLELSSIWTLFPQRVLILVISFSTAPVRMFWSPTTVVVP